MTDRPYEVIFCIGDEHVTVNPYGVPAEMELTEVRTSAKFLLSQLERNVELGREAEMLQLMREAMDRIVLDAARYGVVLDEAD